MISIVIADDHRLVAEGVAKLIEESKVASVVAVIANLRETAAAVQDLQPDLLLLDIAMPDGDGIDAITQLKKICPTLRIIILTIYAETNVIRRAMENGAEGYIFKNANALELIRGVRAVAQGKTYICKDARQLLNGSREASPTLTTREREILRLIVDGYTMKEIADKLCLGFETVHSYSKILRQKLGCSNMATLVRTALEKHLV